MFPRMISYHNKAYHLLQSFSRGSVRHFLLATPRGLGSLRFCRVWHDNSGAGDSASWFLDKLVIEDLHTGEK